MLRDQYEGLKSAILGMKNGEVVGAEVDEGTAERALMFLELMTQYGVTAPKIFSHGGDAVVFCWYNQKLRRYITIDENAVMILDKNHDGDILSDEIVPVSDWTRISDALLSLKKFHFE